MNYQTMIADIEFRGAFNKIAVEATGFLIGPTHLVTNTHVVLDSVTQRTGFDLGYRFLAWFEDGTLAGTAPGSSVTYSPNPDFADGDNTILFENAKDDFAFIQLDKPVGSWSGSFGFVSGLSFWLNAGDARIAGYPAETFDGDTLVADTVSLTYDNRGFVTFASDRVENGSSGSPLWVEINGAPQVLGAVCAFCETQSRVVAGLITAETYDRMLAFVNGDSLDFDLSAIRDFDGNDLGAGGSWKYLGSTDAQYDFDMEMVFVNPVIGRWATVGALPGNPINFEDHGLGGDTRVVGIYIDPLVELGIVERFSDHDSQRRFQNDLFNDNLEMTDAFDFDGDGFQEIYFKLRDGTAHLRALMHADGNIQYANYQNDQQVEDFLSDLGYSQQVVDYILV